MLKIVTSIVFALSLTGCLAIQLGEPYDQILDKDLNSFQKTTAEFLISTQQNSSNKKYNYYSEISKKYYASSYASLSNMELRAKLLSNRPCPSGKIGDYALTLTAASAPENVSGFTSGETAEIQEGLKQLNCVSITILSLQKHFQNLEADHKEMGKISAGVALLNGDAINQSIRVALTTVQANK